MVDFFFGRDAPFFFFSLMLLTSEFFTPSLFFFAVPPVFLTADFFTDLSGADFFVADFFLVPDAGFLPADSGAAFLEIFFEAGLPGCPFFEAAFRTVFFAAGIYLNLAK